MAHWSLQMPVVHRTNWILTLIHNTHLWSQNLTSKAHKKIVFKLSQASLCYMQCDVAVVVTWRIDHASNKEVLPLLVHCSPRFVSGGYLVLSQAINSFTKEVYIEQLFAQRLTHFFNDLLHSKNAFWDIKSHFLAAGYHYWLLTLRAHKFELCCCHS